MPLNPNILERLVLFRLNRGPAPILDLFGAGSFEAVNLAFDLELFEALDGERLTLAELETRVDADEAGLRTLCTFLDAQGYVAIDGDRYRNTSMTTKWLTASSETNMAPWFVFWHELVFPFWREHLETAVRAGEPPVTFYEWCDEKPERWELVQAGFRAAASIIVVEVTDAVDLPKGASTLLDVGGGHGLYAVELCREHPSLSATVFDTPEALAAARREIDDADLGDRMTVAAGDYLADDLGSGYDVALLYNVIHAHDGAENRAIFERVRDSLAPGGRIAVLDQLEGSARMSVGRAGLGFVGLTYLTTLGADIHPYEDLATWLRAAGFTDVTRTAIRGAGPGNTLVQATNPA